MPQGGFGVEMKIEGLDQVEKRLKELERKVGTKIVKRAVRAGAKIILKAAKRRCVKVTGLLQKSLGIKRKVYRRSRVTVDIVGPRRKIQGVGPDGRKRVPFNYAHLVEFGTSHSPAQPFLRPAHDEKKHQVVRTIAKELNEGIEKAARR